MKTPDTDNLTEALAVSASQLKEKVDSHNKLIAAAFGVEDVGNTTTESGNQLRQALYETIKCSKKPEKRLSQRDLKR
jgi:hypothetical protein